MEPASTPGWRITSASLKGSSHGADSPNQDAVRIEEVVGAVVGEAEPTWIAAVADGHGGSRYVRSDVGSRTAVDTAIETVSRLLASGTGGDLELLRTAAPLIVDQWRASVLAHVADTPFTDDEAARAGSMVGDNPVLAYGATLLVAVVNSSGVRLAQIGDGDALVRTHGYAVRPIPGDARLIANETTSLCLDTAASDFRFAELPSSAEVDLVLLASDGYGNSFAAQDWWHTLVGDVAWYVDVHGFEEFSAHLPEWLAESALVGGDDVSAAVLSLPVAARPGPVVIPSAPRGAAGEPTQPPAPSAMAGEQTPTRRARRGLLAALLVAVLAGAAAVGGYAALSGGTDDDPRTPTTISPSPTTSSPSDAPSSTPSEKPRKKKNTNRDSEGPAQPGDTDSGEVDQPPADVPDRPSESKQVPQPESG